jgi:hypothetical protein
MAYDLLDFEASVAIDGYMVVKARPTPRPGPAGLTFQSAPVEPESSFLTPRAVGTGWIPSKSARPLDASRPLFGLFGALTDVQGVIEFANEYGLLGGKLTRSITYLREPPAGDALVASIGELTGSWLEEARSMRVASQLWTAVKGKNRNGIVRVLSKEAKMEAEGKKGPYRLPDLGSLSHFSPTSPRERASRTRTDAVEAVKKLKEGGDPVPLAMDCIISTINWRLPPGVEMTLAWTREGARRPVAHVSLRPATLHQAMWLQFATAVRGGMEYAECPQCHRLFDVPTKGAGRPMKYCSDACKQRAYRARKAKAAASQ